MLVIKNEKIVFERGYGVADLRSRRKIDESHQFPPGIVHQAIHRHGGHAAGARRQAAVRRPLTHIFPDFPDTGNRITIRNLLNHTSGLLDYEDLMAEARARHTARKYPPD